MDAGLRLVHLESAEPVTKEDYLGNTISNIVTETVDKVSQLPTSILDAGEDVLQSFVRDEVFSATANNVPFEVLNDNSMRLRQVPGDADWILRNGYKVWGKKIKMDIDDNLASSIRTRRGETLSDVLHNFQGWDCKTPIPAVIYVFEAYSFNKTTYDCTRLCRRYKL